MVDAHSKWNDAVSVDTNTSGVTISKLCGNFYTHGLLEALVTDNGSTVISVKFAVSQEELHEAYTRSAISSPVKLSERESCVSRERRPTRKKKKKEI